MGNKIAKRVRPVGRGAPPPSAPPPTRNPATVSADQPAPSSREATAQDKSGPPYSSICSDLETFDLLLFRGGDAISDTIRLLERNYLEPRSKLVDSGGHFLGAPDEYSHVGVVVRGNFLPPDQRIDPDGVYIWESTMSGPLADGPPNIDGVSFLGVQLRDLRSVVDQYDAPADTRIAVAPLRKDVRAKLFAESGGDPPGTREAALRAQFAELFRTLDGRPYDYNPASLGGAMVPALRPVRDAVEAFSNTKDWLFCSELVATIYRAIGVFPPEVEPRDVVPMDFLGFDADACTEGGVPVVVDRPIAFVRDAAPSGPAARPGSVSPSGRAPPLPASPDGMCVVELRVCPGMPPPADCPSGPSRTGQ